MRSEGVRHERLPGVAGVDRHAEHEVDAVGGGHRILDGRLRIERDADAQAEGPRVSDCRGGVVARLDVEGDAVSPGLRDGLEVALRLGHHEMAVQPPSPTTHER